ncbi:MAG TPA: hypothetical protein VIG07_04570 [Methylomirabilota bacterium]
MIAASIARGLGVGLLLAAAVASADPAQYVVSFEHVTVRGLGGILDSPDVAHRDLPGGPNSALGDRSERPSELSPDLTRVPVGALAFAPGEGVNNPNFLQNGFLVEAFWAVRLGSTGARFKRAHFHPPDLASGYEAQHFGNPNELHGIFIRSLDGRPFGLKSLRYRVTRNRQLLGKPFSIEGFSNYNVNVLVASAFDPRLSIRSQFVSFPVGLPVGNDPTLPWWPLPITGFELVQQVFIASSASVDLKDIVLVR